MKCIQSAGFRILWNTLRFTSDVLSLHAVHNTTLIIMAELRLILKSS